MTFEGDELLEGLPPPRKISSIFRDLPPNPLDLLEGTKKPDVAPTASGSQSNASLSSPPPKPRSSYLSIPDSPPPAFEMHCEPGVRLVRYNIVDVPDGRVYAIVAGRQRPYLVADILTALSLFDREVRRAEASREVHRE